MAENTQEQFDPHAFLDDLLREMGMDKESDERREALKLAMYQTLEHDLFEAIADNLEPEIAEAIMEEYPDEEDGFFLIIRMAQESPGAQLGMIQALETFKERTLEAYNQLK